MMVDTGIPYKNVLLVSLIQYDYIIYDGDVWLPIDVDDPQLLRPVLDSFYRT